MPDATLADIATCLWRLRAGPADPDRHLDAAFDALAGAGIEVRDHDGDPYDAGQPLTAVRFEPDAGADRDRVVETLRPTVYRGGEVIQPARWWWPPRRPRRRPAGLSRSTGGRSIRAVRSFPRRWGSGADRVGVGGRPQSPREPTNGPYRLARPARDDLPDAPRLTAPPPVLVACDRRHR